MTVVESIPEIPDGMGYPSSKYPGMSGSPDFTPRDYMEMIRTFLEVRRPFVKEWEENERYYDVKPGEVSFEEAERRLGRAFGLVQSEVSNLANARPKLFAQNLNAIDADLAAVYETLINNEWTRDRRAYRETLFAIADVIIYGHGIVFTSYEADFEKAEKRRKERKEELESAKEQGALEALTDSRVDVVRDAEAELSEVTYEQDLRILREDIATRRLSPWDVGWDATARRPEEVRMWWRRIELPLHDLKNGPYNSEAVARLKPGGQFDIDRYWPDKRTRIKGLPKQFKATYLQHWVTAYEIWDIRNNKLVTIAPQLEDQFLRYQDNPYMFPCPFQYTSWNYRGEGMLVRSDLGHVRGTIIEEETIRNKAADALERENIDVYWVDERLGIGEEAIHPVTLPDNSLMIKVRPQGQLPIQQGIFKLPREIKNRETAQHLMVLKQEIQDSIGLGPNQQGSPLKSGSTATEAATINQFANAKTAFRRMAIEEAVESIAFQRLALMVQFYDETKIAQIGGLAVAKKWAALEITAVDFQNRFSVSIEEGSLSPQNDSVRSATYLQLIQLSMTVPVFGQMLDVPELVKRFLDSRGIKDGDPLLLASQQEAVQLLRRAAESQATPGGGGQPQVNNQAPTAAGESQAVLGALGGALAGGQIG